MAFTDQDFRDLLRTLSQRPDWRDELRRYVLSEEVLRLPAVMAQLAESHARTEQQLADLTAQVTALAGRVDSLTAGLDGLTARVDALAEQVSALAGQVSALAKEQRRTRQELGALSELVGARAEADAEAVLVGVLEAKGYRLLSEPGVVTLDGEVDVVAHVEGRDGDRLWAVLQAKARLHRGDITAWARMLRNRAFRARLQEAGVLGPLLPYAFGLRVHVDADEAGKAAGIGILSPRGERIPPGSPAL